MIDAKTNSSLREAAYTDMKTHGMTLYQEIMVRMIAA